MTLIVSFQGLPPMTNSPSIPTIWQTSGHTLSQMLSRSMDSLQVAWRSLVDWPWTLPILFLVIAIAALATLFFAHRKWKRGWLSGLMAARLAAARTHRPQLDRVAPMGRRNRAVTMWLAILERWDDLITYLGGRFLSDLKAPYLPSLASFVIIGLLIALFFLIPNPPSLTIALHSHWQDWWRGLTADLRTTGSKMDELITGAFTGLAVVVIALVVFVAESIRDDNDYERKRVLVRISWLWPLGLAATLIPFGLLWSAARGFTILLEVIIAAITLIAFGRVIRALLDPDTRAQNRLALLRSRVHGMIFDSVRERIGNAILLEQLGTNNRIDAMHYMISRAWIEDDAQGYLFIDAPEDGWMADIQLDELKKLSDRLDRYAREALGFALRESGPKTQVGVTGAAPTVQMDPPLAVQKAYLLKRYREEIPPDSIFYGKRRSLFALPQDFSKNPALLADIRAAIPHIFRFTKDEPSSAAIRREMQGTKDQLAQAIRNHALGAIDELRQTYLQIAEEFLTLLVEFGGGYTAEQAIKESGNFFESWSEIRWLSTDLRELIIIAADAGNTEVLSTIGFLPFAIAIRAVQARDHFLFQQFYQFAAFLYVRARDRESGSRVYNWMIEKAWRWPKEIADFYVAPELESKTATPSELEHIRGFALYSLRVFQDLLKLMADKRDVVAFTTVAHEFRKLYRRFREKNHPPRAPLLRLQVERAQNEIQRTLLQAQLDRHEKLDDMATVLDMAIDTILLALGGRILAQRLEAQEDTPIESLLTIVKAMLPTSLEKLAKAFAEASDWQASDIWGWDEWDLVADGEAHWVDQHTKLNQIFAVCALEVLAALPPEARGAVQLPVSHSLAEMARENNQQGLLATLGTIEASPERWEVVLSAGARDCIGVFRERLAAVREAEQALAAERTRNAPLDTARLREFRDQVIRSFAESGRLRAILRAKGVVDRHLNEHPGASMDSFGVNQIDDKNAFIAQEHTDYGGWGLGYGQGLAEGEDEAAFAAMIAGAGVQRAIAQSTVYAVIDEILREVNLRDPIILQSLGFEIEQTEIRDNPAFISTYDPELHTPWRGFNGFMGLLAVAARQIPVFDTFVQRPDSLNKVLILDAEQFLHWRQFIPDDTSGNEDDIVGELLIRVIDLNANEERRNAIIAQNPPWLAQESDPVAYLRGRVLINVYEKFRIDIVNANAGICLSLAGVLQGQDDI